MKCFYKEVVSFAKNNIFQRVQTSSKDLSQSKQQLRWKKYQWKGIPFTVLFISPVCYCKHQGRRWVNCILWAHLAQSRYSRSIQRLLHLEKKSHVTVLALTDQHSGLPSHDLKIILTPKIIEISEQKFQRIRESAQKVWRLTLLKDVYKKICTALQHIFFHFFLKVIGILKI